MGINIGLSNQQRLAVNSILNALLADEYVLYTKTRNYHWNVRGIHFYEFHKFFENQYDQLDAFIDDVAERVCALDGDSVGTLADFLKNTRLKEDIIKVTDVKSMIRNLLEDHENIIRTLRSDLVKVQNNLGDSGTSDFLTGMMENHEKMAWMLRSMTE